MVKQVVRYILFLVLQTPVFSQLWEIDSLEMLSVSSQYEEIKPLMMADSGLFFVRAGHPENIGGEFAGQDIWFAPMLPDGTFKDSSNLLGGLNNKLNNAICGISSDGRKLYLYDSKRQLSFSELKGSTWGDLERIKLPGLPRNKGVDFYVHSEYDVIILSFINDLGNYDLYISTLQDGKWSIPRNMGNSVNSSGDEFAPFLSKDKRYLFFSSTGHPGYGDADIFVSVRLYDSWDVWSRPINVAEINSSAFDAYLTISHDSTIYLSSNRNGSMSDLYKGKLLSSKLTVNNDSINQMIKEAELLLQELKKGN